MSTNQKELDIYTELIGSKNISEQGKAFINTYISKNNIKIPSVKKQVSMELSLLKNKEIQDELLENYTKKGYSKKLITNMIKPYNPVGSFFEGATGILMLPLSMFSSKVLIKDATQRKYKKASIIENAVGDRKNEKTNAMLEEKLSKKGYNAYRDLNDRGNDIAKSSIVILNQNDVEQISSKNLSKKDFVTAYANQRINATAKKDQTEEIYNRYIKDGKNIYSELQGDYKESQRNKKRNK